MIHLCVWYIVILKGTIVEYVFDTIFKFHIENAGIQGWIIINQSKVKVLVELILEKHRDLKISRSSLDVLGIRIWLIPLSLDIRYKQGKFSDMLFNVIFIKATKDFWWPKSHPYQIICFCMLDYRSACSSMIYIQR